MARLELQPAIAVIRPGESVQVEAIAYDGDDHVVPSPGTTWDATGGAISGGLFTAGGETGIFHAIASVDGTNAMARLIVLPADAPEGPVITGIVTWNDRPVVEVTSNVAMFWMRDESTGRSSPPHDWLWNADTGEYALYGFPEGHYGIQADLNKDQRRNGFPGDYYGWHTIMANTGSDIYELDQLVREGIHLGLPRDNATATRIAADVEILQNGQILFDWDPIAEATNYTVEVITFSLDTGALTFQFQHDQTRMDVRSTAF